mmetsp:Transcript_45273/g.140036  ORF Transcript_45273/g.140036 Transcript_45273/m.140036 type:complete len:200 (+) Transcript_45273:677-1276(+)
MLGVSLLPRRVICLVLLRGVELLQSRIKLCGLCQTAEVRTRDRRLPGTLRESCDLAAAPARKLPAFEEGVDDARRCCISAFAACNQPHAVKVLSAAGRSIVVDDVLVAKIPWWHVVRGAHDDVHAHGLHWRPPAGRRSGLALAVGARGGHLELLLLTEDVSGSAAQLLRRPHAVGLHYGLHLVHGVRLCEDHSSTAAWR